MSRAINDHMSIVKGLNRIGMRKPLQRTGLLAEPVVALPSDTPEVVQLLADEGFAVRLAELAGTLRRDRGEVMAEAAGYLREMGAVHSARVMDGWSRFITWMFRAHDLLVDEEAARRLRRLDRDYSLLFLFSHRSYLDGAAVPLALARHGISPAYTLGGANLNFFPSARWPAVPASSTSAGPRRTSRCTSSSCAPTSGS
jgi:glycerol-3-phosphate O-acyltransferase